MNNLKYRLQKSKIYWVYDKDLADKYDPKAELFQKHLVSGYIDLLQFRAKNIDMESYMKWVDSLKSKIDLSSVLTFTNDHVECISELGLDGVHIGADDMPVQEARSLLGDNVLIGSTARTLTRALSSLEEGADYLGVGTVFSTNTKPGLITQGPDFAKSVKDSVDIPVFAIGGIKSGNVNKLVKLGVNRVAVASSLLNQTNSKDELFSLYKQLS